MTGKTRSPLLSLALIAVLFFVALSPTIAYADDGTPPDPPPTEVNTGCTADGECPSGEEAIQPTGEPTEVIVAETTTPDEATADPTSAAPEATTEAISPPDEAPAQAGGEGTSSGEAASIARRAPDSSILDAVPDGTTITIVDAAGQAQPLATQIAAEAIATSDPIWCPAGQTPTPGANGCTDSFTSFDALLTFLSGNANFQGAGVIYVQEGAYNGGETIIDFNSPAYDLSNISNSDLTITGGWNTTTNVVDPAGTSTFNIPITIGSSTNPWGGTLFISNITITNPLETGLSLNTEGEIFLLNVNVIHSENGAGAELTATGDVSIANSTFDRNKTAGAIIRSGGDVAILNSSFSNTPNGRRQIVGLDVLSNGAVVLVDVLANHNREVGANINAGGRVTITTSFFSGTKATKGTGANTEFLGYGLQVVTPDSIDLIGVTASDNFLWGASLNNCVGPDTSACTGTGDVTIADSVFNANTTESPGFIDDTGLLITSNGSVALRNVKANDNRLIGAVINTTGDVAISESEFTGNKGETIDGTGATTFHGYGLQVVTQGNISIRAVNASGNTLFGAHLEAGQDITVADSNFSNQTSGSATDQTGRGLEIIAGGNVFLSNLVIENNQLFGADIQAGNDVSLAAISANNNGLNGVNVQTSCNTVALIGGSYTNNGQFGLSVINSALTQSGSPVFAGNGAGDIFQDPGTCIFNAATPTPGTGSGSVPGTVSGIGTSAGTTTTAFTFNPVQAGSQSNTIFNGLRGLTGIGAPNVSLNSFLRHTRIANGDVELSIFTGQFAYVYSDSGILSVISVAPASSFLAMGTP